MRLRSLTETLLYRGDGEHVERFDLMRTDYAGLFGMGIYLTTDPDVAHDYTVARGDHRVFPTTRWDPESKSIRELLRNYAISLASTFNESAFKDDWVRRNGYGSRYQGLPSAAHDALNRDMEEAKQRGVTQQWQEAVAQVRKELPTLRVLRRTTGELVLVRRERQAAVSVFDIPDNYLAKTIHGDRPLSDRDLAAIKRLWRTVFNRGSDGDLRDADEKFVSFDDYVQNYRTRGTRYAWRDEGEDDWWRGGTGENPTLDDLLNGTHAGSNVFKDGMFDKERPKAWAFIKTLQKLGYVGIEYDGGKRVGQHVRGGGGKRHRAFVFWNVDDLHRFRLPNAPLPAGDELSPRAVPPKDMSKLTRRPRTTT